MGQRYSLAPRARPGLSIRLTSPGETETTIIPSRLPKKSSARVGLTISPCDLCGSPCLCGENANKNTTTEAQRSHREPQRGSANAPRFIFQQPASALIASSRHANHTRRLKWMTAALPRSIADIEAFIAKARREQR